MNSTLALVRALVFLQTRTLLNAFRMRLRRLKQPKYLIGAVVGLGYLYLWLGRPLLHDFRGGGESLAVSGEQRLIMEAVAALLLFFVVAAQWIFLGSRASLQFTETELAFLLPAPLSRRALVRYKLIRGQLGTLVSALFLTVFTGRFARDGHAVMFALSWWLVLTTLNLHSIAASFTVQRLSERGLSSWRRRMLALLIVLGLAGVTVWWLRRLPPPQAGLSGEAALRDLGDWLQLALNSGPAPWLLAPFRWLVQPWFAPDFPAFLQALVPVIALILLHFLWIERCDVRFEEASLEAARKRAELVASARAGKLRGYQAPTEAVPAPFPLRPLGPPAVALVWKHLIHVRITPRKLGIGLALVGLFAVGVRLPFVPEEAGVVLTAILLIGVAALTLVGGALTSLPFRRDLNELDVLKGYPVPAWHLVLGQMLGGAAVIGLVQALTALAAALCYRAPDPDWELSPLLVALGAASYLILVLPLNLVNALVPSAATLLFPAWARAPREAHQAGFEIMGQRIVLGLVQLLATAVAWLPAGLVGAAAFLVGHWLGGPLLGVPLAALFGATVLLGEAAAGIWGLAKLFERYDASAEQ